MKILRIGASMVVALALAMSTIVVSSVAYADDARDKAIKDIIKRSVANRHSWVEKADGTKTEIQRDDMGGVSYPDLAFGDTVVIKSDPLPADAHYLHKAVKKGQSIDMRIPIDCSLKDKEQKWIEGALIYDDSELDFYAAEMNPSIPLNESTVFTDHSASVSLVFQKADFSSCDKTPQEPPVSEEPKTQEEILNYIHHRSWADRKATVTDRNAKIKKVKSYGEVTYGDVITFTSGPLPADMIVSIGMGEKKQEKLYQRGQSVKVSTRIDCSFKPNEWVGFHGIYVKRDNPPADYPQIFEYGEDIATYHKNMLLKGGTDIDFTAKVVGDYKKCNIGADPLKKKDVTAVTDKQKTKSTEQKSSLAKTGSDSLFGAVIAVVLVLLGGALVVMRRKNRI